MAIANFKEVVSGFAGTGEKAVLAVAAAGDAHALEAVWQAEDDGFITPALVGDEKKIREIYAEHGRTLEEGMILIDEPDLAEAAKKAVALIREGKADFLLKGAVDSGAYLRAVVNKETGLGKGGLMSHFAVLEIPGYHKLVAVVDSGMVAYPDLEQKKEILKNTAEVFHKLGYETVKAAALCCTEKENPKMRETVEAADLARASKAGELPGIIVEGPISYDIAMSPEIAAEKHYESAVAGDADILLADNVHMGNVLGKCLTVTCGAKMAGFVVGTVCPVVMTSRGSSAEEKYNSIVLAARIAR